MHTEQLSAFKKKTFKYLQFYIVLIIEMYVYEEEILHYPTPPCSWFSWIVVLTLLYTLQVPKDPECGCCDDEADVKTLT